MNSLLMLLYCHLFNIYELTNSKLAFFYLKKIISLAIIDMLPYVFTLITKSQELFGEAADLHINPSIILFLVRLTDVCLSSLTRANFSQMKMLEDPDHSRKHSTDPKYRKLFDSTGRFIIGMEKTVRVCLTGCSILSSRYYFAWISIKLRNYFLKVVTSPKFYKMNVEQNLQFIRPSEEQLTELADLTDRALEKIQTFINDSTDTVNVTTLFKENKRKRAPKTKKNQSQSQSQQQSQSQSQSHLVPQVPATFPSTQNKDNNNTTEEQASTATSHKNLKNLTSEGVSPSMNISDEVFTPLSVDSTGNAALYSTQFEDLTFDNGPEIDSIWLQMLNSKTFNQNDGFNGAASIHYPPMMTTNNNNSTRLHDQLHPNNTNNNNMNNAQFYSGNHNTAQQINGLFGYPLQTQQFNLTSNTNQPPSNNSVPTNDNSVYYDLFDEFPLNTLFN